MTEFENQLYQHKLRIRISSVLKGVAICILLVLKDSPFNMYSIGECEKAYKQPLM